LLYILFVIPVLGVLWFLNLVSLLKKIKADRNHKNETILGAVYSFFLALPIMFILAAVLY
jgi:RsiW-degrading membrane proteinase PrsW (M82 family)